ncbi:MAG: hypothetical protein ACE5FU_01075 [Nitrospinota bacterium]
MEKYPKLFVKAGIIYLLIGVLVGLLLSFNPMLGINPVFLHVHINLLGFMGFVIFGIAYHILPRFNARPIAHPWLIPVHFYSGNVGLVGMVFSYVFSAPLFFQVFSIVATGSVLIFVFNILPVLGETITDAEVANQKTQVSPEPESEEKENFISEEEKLGAVLEALPELEKVIEDAGIKDISNPAFRAGFAKIVSIKQVCTQNNIPLEPFIEKLNAVARVKGFTSSLESPKKVPAPKESRPPEKEEGAKATPTLKQGELCRGDVFIGDLLNVYPETKKIIEKHYGSGCFSCPGQANETILQSTQMHGINIDMILEEINGEIKKRS